jgi:hypothetical protein
MKKYPVLKQAFHWEDIFGFFIIIIVDVHNSFKLQFQYVVFLLCTAHWTTTR